MPTRFYPPHNVGKCVTNSSTRMDLYLFIEMWICSISEVWSLSILLARRSKKGLGSQDGNVITFLSVSMSLILKEMTA